jgi:hypothetical protein
VIGRRQLLTQSDTSLRDFGATQHVRQTDIRMLDQLFDHLVGNGEHIRWKSQAKRFLRLRPRAHHRSRIFAGKGTTQHEIFSRGFNIIADSIAKLPYGIGRSSWDSEVLNCPRRTRRTSSWG